MGKLIYKEEEISFKCINCGEANNYTSYIERDDDSAFVQLTGDKPIDLNNIDVNGDILSINEEVRCKYCNRICKINIDLIYKYNY